MAVHDAATYTNVRMQSATLCRATQIWHLQLRLTDSRLNVEDAARFPEYRLYVYRYLACITSDCRVALSKFSPQEDAGKLCAPDIQKAAFALYNKAVHPTAYELIDTTKESLSCKVKVKVRRCTF